MRDKIIVQDLLLQVVIGAYRQERTIKQNLVFTLTLFTDFSKCAETDNVEHTIDYVSVSRAVAAYADRAHHFTIEALAVGVARICCLGFGVEEVIVRIEKPGALKLAKAPVVEITRTREYFHSTYQVDAAKHPPALHEEIERTGTQYTPPNPFHYAYLALGSNVGDRLATIYNALDALKKHGRVVSTSHIYETPAAYITDQPAFINAACLFETTLEPEDLLTFIQSIEIQFGRQRTIKYGPRTLDLDILFYDRKLVNTPTLIIPHPLIQERDFVLGPLLDIAPNFLHPVLFLTIQQLFFNLSFSTSLYTPGPKAHHHMSTLKRVTPVRNVLWDSESKTYVVGVLNVTPDSLSDGGKYMNVDAAVAHAEKLVAEGADIVDIGGQSTKPGVPLVSEEEEINRILPVIKAFRQKNSNTPISVDTFNSKVAEQALLAGADIINDVTGGKQDPLIFEVAAKFRVPIILTFSVQTPQYEELRRATPDKLVPPFFPSLSPLSSLSPSSSPTVTAIGDPPEYDLLKNTLSFFSSQIAKASAAGVYRWQIIVDPGLGFGKTYDQSRELIKRGKELVDFGYTVMMGPSRKGFIANTLDLANDTPQSKEREMGGLAMSTLAAAAGVHMLRVHDVSLSLSVIRATDKLYKL